MCILYCLSFDLDVQTRLMYDYKNSYITHTVCTCMSFIHNDHIININVQIMHNLINISHLKTSELLMSIHF